MLARLTAASQKSSANTRRPGACRSEAEGLSRQYFCRLEISRPRAELRSLYMRDLTLGGNAKFSVPRWPLLEMRQNFLSQQAHRFEPRLRIIGIVEGKQQQCAE